MHPETRMRASAPPAATEGPPTCVDSDVLRLALAPNSHSVGQLSVLGAIGEWQIESVVIHCAIGQVSPLPPSINCDTATADELIERRIPTLAHSGKISRRTRRRDALHEPTLCNSGPLFPPEGRAGRSVAREPESNEHDAYKFAPELALQKVKHPRGKPSLESKR